MPEELTIDQKLSDGCVIQKHWRNSVDEVDCYVFTPKGERLGCLTYSKHVTPLWIVGKALQLIVYTVDRGFLEHPACAGISWVKHEA